MESLDGFAGSSDTKGSVMAKYKIQYTGKDKAVFKRKPGQRPFFARTISEFEGKTIEIGYSEGIELVDPDYEPKPKNSSGSSSL